MNPPPSASSASNSTALPSGSLPNDLATCQAVIQQLHEALEQAQRRTRQLEHRLELLLKARFGPRADRLNPAQLLLFAEELLAQAEAAAPAPTSKSAASPRKGHGRRRLPAELPRQQVVHDLSDAEKPCPCCGTLRVQIGQETSEQLEYEPAKLYVLEHVRPTYACPICSAQTAATGPQITTAAKPLQPIEKGLAGPGLLAAVITNKFSDHLPLYRQEAILARSGQPIARSTTCGWLAACAALVLPFYALLKDRVRHAKYVNTDDTPVPVLDPRRGKTREGRLWVYVDPAQRYTVFDYTPTHSRDGPLRFFGGYAGYIQADAYTGYDVLFKPKADGTPGPTELGCWAHARRKFTEAQTNDARRAVTAVAFIRRLYDVEHAAEACDAAARRARRQEQSVPILDQLKTWLDEQQGQVLPKSPIGEAIGYCLGNWAALTRYVEDGDLKPDNNAAENAIRPLVVGRKNWLFAGSDNGGRTAAVLASLVASAKQHGLDPFVYLRDMLTRIAATPVSQLEQFLPDRWKAAHLPAALLD
jgi:transposase